MVNGPTAENCVSCYIKKFRQETLELKNEPDRRTLMKLNNEELRAFVEDKLQKY